MKILKGITWNHTRGLLPLQAAAQIYHEEHPDVQIIWEKRSLQAFADAPLESMTQYDMLVIDHPHAGAAAYSKTIVPIEDFLELSLLQNLQENSVGASYNSYVFEGKLWALPIDAATPVSVYRPDLLATAGEPLPKNWSDVLRLAKTGHVVMPAIPVNSLMDFYMFCLACGGELFSEECVVAKQIGRQALEELRRITQYLPVWCKEADPITVHHYLSRSEKEFYCPSAYGYSVYSMKGYAKHLLMGAPVVAYRDKPMQSTLGGTGLAISVNSPNKAIAFDYARTVVEEDFQKSVYVSAGGQPGHRQAWINKYTNTITNYYFQDTLPALDRSFLRPRYNGYIDFQDSAGNLIFEYRHHGGNPSEVLEKLEKLYAERPAKEGY